MSIMYAIEYRPFAEIKELVNCEHADINFRNTSITTPHVSLML